MPSIVICTNINVKLKFIQNWLPVDLHTCCILAYPAQCQGVFYGETGWLSAPGHPEHYLNKAKCTWMIEVPEGNGMEIMFHDAAQIEYHPTCYYDNLKVRSLYCLLYIDVVLGILDSCS